MATLDDTLDNVEIDISSDESDNEGSNLKVLRLEYNRLNRVSWGGGVTQKNPTPTLGKVRLG